MKSTDKVINVSLVEAIKKHRDEYVIRASDNNVKALLRRLFYRLGYLVYNEAEQDEITRVKQQIDDLLEEHGMNFCKINASKLLMGVQNE